MLKKVCLLSVLTLLISLCLATDFKKFVIDGPIKDGYWILPFDVDNDGWIDLATSGLALGEIDWYKNPGVEGAKWEKHFIYKFDKTVSFEEGDFDGDGYSDIVVGHDYGNCMFDCRPQDGKISWLRNPGSKGKKWKAYHVADLVATHRLKVGKFTQNEKLEVMALPVVSDKGGKEGVNEPVKVTLYKIPDPSVIYKVAKWDSEIIDDKNFRVIHGVIKRKFRAGSDLESVLLASKEGITFLYYNEETKSWARKLIGTGELSEYDKTGFKGSGNVDICKIGIDDFALIVTAEPFHGNSIAVYSKDFTNSIEDLTWQRDLVYVAGHPNYRGESPAHHILCADFDGDNVDEFLVALRGPLPYQGIRLFKTIKNEEDVVPKYSFKVSEVSLDSAARIALADFNKDGLLDFATTGYYTPGYYLCDNPEVIVFYNNPKKNGGFTSHGIHIEETFNFGAQNTSSFSTLFPPNAITFGIQPTGWVNDDFQLLGHDTYTYGQIMDEIALAGFSGGSVGHKYPKEIPQLKEELKLRGLRVSEPWTSTYFTIEGQYKKTIEDFLESMQFIKTMGGNRVVVAEFGKSVHLTSLSPFANKPVFTKKEFNLLASGLNEIGALAYQNGMTLCYHFHLGTGVMNRNEIDKLMNLTNSTLVKLLVDTGHGYAAGVDPLQLIKDYKDRVRHVHLKNIRNVSLQKALNTNSSFYEAILDGLFTVPGDDEGILDFEPILKELANNKYEGWLVVEAEQDPSKATPLKMAKMARSYLKKIIGY